jgi:hypothetical protein
VVKPRPEPNHGGRSQQKDVYPNIRKGRESRDDAITQDSKRKNDHAKAHQEGGLPSPVREITDEGSNEKGNKGDNSTNERKLEFAQLIQYFPLLKGERNNLERPIVCKVSYRSDG